MAKLERISIEKPLGLNGKRGIRIDWDNDRHQEIEIEGDTPKDLIETLQRCVYLLRSEIHHKEI